MAGKKKTEKKALDAKAGGLAALWTIGLIAAAIAIIAISSLLLPGIGRAMREPDRFAEAGGAPSPMPEWDVAPLEENLALRLGLSLLNVVLAIYLLFIYVKDYLSLRAGFTLGLVAFLFSFLLYALSSFPLVRVVLGPYGIASSLSFVPMLFSAIGLLIFAKLSND